MRLSEAFMLGITTCELKPGNIDFCAYGCALNAMGVPKEEDIPVGNRWLAAIQLWPWMKQKPRLANAIWARFDDLVCNGQMSLEQLHDYIKENEPDCDCCRFSCCCAEKAAEAVEAVEAAESYSHIDTAAVLNTMSKETT